MFNLQHSFIIFLISLCLILSSSLQADSSVKPTNKATYSNINNQDLQKLIKEGVLVVDIRREEEWKHTGIIEGSKTITFFDKQGRVTQDFLPKFTAIAKKDQPVILICRTGGRTRVASQAIAQQLGYEKVINVTHGIMNWIGEKKPVTQYKK